MAMQAPAVADIAMHELLSPTAQAQATVTLTVLENQVLRKGITDFASMPFTEFATLHAVRRSFENFLHVHACIRYVWSRHVTITDVCRQQGRI